MLPIDSVYIVTGVLVIILVPPHYKFFLGLLKTNWANWLITVAQNIQIVHVIVLHSRDPAFLLPEIICAWDIAESGQRVLVLKMLFLSALARYCRLLLKCHWLEVLAALVLS